MSVLLDDLDDFLKKPQKPKKSIFDTSPKVFSLFFFMKIKRKNPLEKRFSTGNPSECDVYRE